MKRFFVASLLGACLFGQTAKAQDAPRHLQLAREFAAHTKQTHNTYSNRKVYTRMPGDGLENEYVVSTDCSGFVEDMFRRTDGGVLAQLTTQTLKTRHNTLDFHASIQRQEAFRQIHKVNDIQPGDVAVWRYLKMADH